MPEKNSQSRPYDVVLVPESSLARKAIELSGELKAKGVYFTLDGKTFFPHISFYMLQLNKAGLDKAIELLSDMVSDMTTVRVIADKYHYEANYVDVEYVKTKELELLQAKIIEKLNPIRDGLREKDKERLASAVGETKFNLENYGYRSIGGIFYPHLTFARFTSSQEDVLRSLPLKDRFSGIFDKLGVYEMGDNGTCVREVKTWNLID